MSQTMSAGGKSAALCNSRKVSLVTAERISTAERLTRLETHQEHNGKALLELQSAVALNSEQGREIERRIASLIQSTSLRLESAISVHQKDMAELLANHQDQVTVRLDEHEQSIDEVMRDHEAEKNKRKGAVYILTAAGGIGSVLIGWMTDVFDFTGRGG